VPKNTIEHYVYLMWLMLGVSLKVKYMPINLDILKN